MTDADDRREDELRRGRYGAPIGAASAEDNIPFLLRRLDEARTTHGPLIEAARIELNAAHERRVADLRAANNEIIGRIDDLLRDAARLDWLVKHPDRAQIIFGLLGPENDARRLIDAQIAREKGRADG